jgi:hypothetical protein
LVFGNFQTLLLQTNSLFLQAPATSLEAEFKCMNFEVQEPTQGLANASVGRWQWWTTMKEYPRWHRWGALRGT